MRFLEKSTTALKLSSHVVLAQAQWMANQYPRRRKEIQGYLVELGIDDQIYLPDSHDEYVSHLGNFISSIEKGLLDERCRLGGDGYAYTFFILGLSVYSSMSGLAFDLTEDEMEISVGLFSDCLLDLGIQNQEQDIVSLLKDEISWIKSAQAAQKDQIELTDMLQGWEYLMNKIIRIWAEAEKRRAEDIKELSLTDVPMHKCFISYNRNDKRFATHLYNQLRKQGVLVWYAEDKMVAGEKIDEQINRGIKSHDKVILVLSKNSIVSDWVEYEIQYSQRVAIENDMEVLIPVLLVAHDSGEFQSWSVINTENPDEDIADLIRSRLLPDFTNWESEASFKKSFDQLMRAIHRETWQDLS